jgi:hypothetical protein
VVRAAIARAVLSSIALVLPAERRAATRARTRQID